MKYERRNPIRHLSRILFQDIANVTERKSLSKIRKIKFGWAIGWFFLKIK